MNSLTEGIITVATLIIGLAALSVIVSRNAQTSAVVKSFGDVFTGSLTAATRPVSGNGFGSF